MARDPCEDALHGIPIREGDVLFLGLQTAVLLEDRPPVGWLGANDLVVHTYHRAAEIAEVGALPYRRHGFRVLRWPGIPADPGVRPGIAPAGAGAGLTPPR